MSLPARPVHRTGTPASAAHRRERQWPAPELCRTGCTLQPGGQYLARPRRGAGRNRCGLRSAFAGNRHRIARHAQGRRRLPAARSELPDRASGVHVAGRRCASGAGLPAAAGSVAQRAGDFADGRRPRSGPRHKSSQPRWATAPIWPTSFTPPAPPANPRA